MIRRAPGAKLSPFERTLCSGRECVVHPLNGSLARMPQRDDTESGA